MLRHCAATKSFADHGRCFMKRFEKLFAVILAVMFAFASCANGSGGSGSSGDSFEANYSEGEDDPDVPYSVESDGGEITVTAEENGLRFIFTNNENTSFAERCAYLKINRVENGKWTTIAQVDLTLEEDSKIEVLYPLVQKDKNYIFAILYQNFDGIQERVTLPAVKAKGGSGHMIYPDLTKSYVTTTWSKSKVKTVLSDNTWIEKNSSRMKNLRTLVNYYYTHGHTSDKMDWDDCTWFYEHRYEGVTLQMPKYEYESIDFNRKFYDAKCSTHGTYADQFAAQYIYEFDLPSGIESEGINLWGTNGFDSNIVTIPADNIVNRVAEVSVAKTENSNEIVFLINLYSDKTFYMYCYNNSTRRIYEYWWGKYTGEIDYEKTIEMQSITSYDVWTNYKYYYDDTSTFTLTLRKKPNITWIYGGRTECTKYYEEEGELNTLEYTLKYPITF
jgi:hypothetical protein